MKNCICFFILILLLADTQSACSQLRLGLHGGINISSPDPQPQLSAASPYGWKYGYSTARIAYCGGLISDFKLTKYINIVIECNYYQTGYKFFDSASFMAGGVTSRHSTTKMNLFELKCLFLYGLPLGLGKINIGFGGSGNYLLSGKIEEFSTNSIYGSGTHYWNIDQKKFFAAASGVIKYELNSGIFFEIIYNYLFKTPSNIYIGNSKKSPNISTFELCGGFMLRFKKNNKR